MTVTGKRIGLLGLGMTVALFACLGRLFQIQVLESVKLARCAVSQRCVDILIEPERGRILDRNHRSLMGQKREVRLAVFPSLVEPRALKMASSLAGVPYEELESRASRTKEPFVLDVPHGDLGEVIKAFEGVGGVVPFSAGRYGKDSLARHIVGYVDGTGKTGVTGIEASYEEFIGGEGERVLSAIVDAKGRLLPGLGYRTRTEGASSHDVVLTLDATIQRIVEDVMDKKVGKGAVVVLQPQTGDILAMASRPNFDQARVGDYLKRSDAALVNRALQGYPPGSIFKTVVAAAALEQNLVTMDEVFHCSGEIRVGNLSFKCSSYEDGGHGSITFQDAMAFSCNAVFIEVGQRLEAKAIVDYAKSFGIGQDEPLGLSGEGKGNLPDPKVITAGDLANISIGQGELLVTPLEMARVVATVANGGILPELHLVKEIIQQDGMIVRSFLSRSKPERIISNRTAQSLRDALLAVTRKGSGKSAYVPLFGSAGKTGSAETGLKRNDGTNILHAWFVGFTPVLSPEYVISVLVENGGSGGEVAAPVFKEIACRILESR